jgi:hypothetical protein
MINYTGINHLAMVTGNMTATIRFWRDLLGMRLVAGLGRPGYRHYFFEISAFDHVSIGVAEDDDLWKIKEKLEAAGIWVSELIDHGFIHSIYSFDPNNIPIEFSAPVPEVDLRRHPRMYDKAPLGAAQEGPDPRTHHWPEPVRSTPMDERTVYPGEGTIFRSSPSH